MRPLPLLAFLALACSSPTATRPNLTLVGGGQYLCTDSTLVAEPPPPSTGSGAEAFVLNCGGCHAGRDGFDVAYFSYPDSVIVRRALGHVDSATSRLISDYVLGLPTPHVPEMDPVFQPGGAVIPGTPAVADVNFALATFGQDGWPANYTRGDVLALDPRSVRIGLPLLPWSDETNTREWMPKDSLPTSIRLAAQSALDAYFANPSIPGLEAVNAAADGAAKTGVCNLNNGSIRNFPACFEIHRWLASLSATHKLRNGGQFLSPALYFQWWHVGDIARRSRGVTGQQIPDYLHHQARWMYLGWMFDVPNEPAVYGTLGLRNLGYPRHAVWVALRSIVARAPGDFAEDTNPYIDFREAAISAPVSWAYQSGLFALNELMRRYNAGDRPTTSLAKTQSRAFLDAGMTSLQGKVTTGQYATLNALADQLRVGL